MKQIQQAAFGLLTLSILALLNCDRQLCHPRGDGPTVAQYAPTRDAESFERKDGPGGHAY